MKCDSLSFLTLTVDTFVYYLISASVLFVCNKCSILYRVGKFAQRSEIVNNAMDCWLFNVNCFWYINEFETMFTVIRKYAPMMMYCTIFLNKRYENIYDFTPGYFRLF